MQFIINKLYHPDVYGIWEEGMKRRKFVYLVGLATMTGGLTIACGNNSDSTNTVQNPSAKTTAANSTNTGEEVVIYSGRNEKLIGELIKQFESESGI
ncbi:ferric iron-binding periplasmic protein of ABC transporter [Richelia intracellularis]|nr:ferric iron-binding periplasmic protein of ABC transporter [Richelia intracellularis]